jgi:hypothetical protein
MRTYWVNASRLTRAVKGLNKAQRRGALRAAEAPPKRVKDVLLQFASSDRFYQTSKTNGMWSLYWSQSDGKTSEYNLGRSKIGNAACQFCFWLKSGVNMLRLSLVHGRGRSLFEHFCLGSALPHLVLVKPDGNCLAPTQTYQGTLRLRPLTRLCARVCGQQRACPLICRDRRN